MSHEGWARREGVSGSTMLGERCQYIERSGTHDIPVTLPGDLVTVCTATAVWRVVRVQAGGVAVLAAAGMTPGDSWKAGKEYWVHVAHLQHAAEHDDGDLFAELGAQPGGSQHG